MIAGIVSSQLKRQHPAPSEDIRFLAHLNGAHGSTTFAEATGKQLLGYSGAAHSNLQFKFPPTSLLTNRTRHVYTPDAHADIDTSGAWSLDWWVRFSSNSGNAQYFVTLYSPVTGRNLYVYRSAGASALYVQSEGAFQSNSNIPSGWVHVLIGQAQNGAPRVFLNGVLDSEFAPMGFFDLGPVQVFIGAGGPPVGADGFGLAGNIQEVRFVAGSCPAESFTPPTAPYVFP